MKYAYFLVEGQHDIEAIGRILVKFHRATRVKKISELERYWERLVPRTFPHGGDLLKRVPVPVFFNAENYSVAIQTARGDSQLASTLINTLGN